MKLRLPLLPKILGWFFLNLLVLAGALFFLVRYQLQFGLDSLLSGRTGERIEALSQALVGDLQEKSPANWDEVLGNFGKAYQVSLYLFRPDGTQAAGENLQLPAVVTTKISEHHRVGGGLGRGPPAGRGPRRGWENMAGAVRPGAEFIVHTESPRRYWVGVRLPITEPDSARPWPLILVVSAESLTAGGLFLDLKPWVFVGVGALLFSVLFWIPLVGGVTRSLSKMTRATQALAEGRFDARVDEKRGDELGRLGEAINRMAVRLAGFVSGQKRFLGDIAHELCSPIARLQVALGILEQRAESSQKPYLEDLREELQQMSALVNELLSFSKAGLASAEIKLQPVNVAELVARVAAREAPDGQLKSEIDPALKVLAEPELLGRALANLVRNARRYADGAGPVTISGARESSRVRVLVTDSGPGVPESLLEQIFDPFVRGEPSRSRETGGIGLGLAIVKTCVEACQGSVRARNVKPHGLQIDLLLESAPEE